MAKLAIRGHKERGKEVIALLEMLGGKNNPVIPYNGSDEEHCYFITKEGNISISKYDKDSTEKYIVLTLELFEVQFPYKVGDKVIDMIGLHGTITTMNFDECNCTVLYTFEDDEVGTSRHGYTALMLKPYIVDTGCCSFPATQPSYTLSVGSIKDMKRSIIFGSDSPNETELVLGDNFEIQVKDGKFFIVRKKPKYPKTYEECCEVVNASPYVALVYDKFDGETYSYDIDNLQIYENIRELKICRDAYWKIAGDWNPDFANHDEKFIIACYYGKIYTTIATNYNRVLVFPTAEMRDAFYENFKELIQQCKELL